MTSKSLRTYLEHAQKEGYEHTKGKKRKRIKTKRKNKRNEIKEKTKEHD